MTILSEYYLSWLY